MVDSAGRSGGARACVRGTQGAGAAPRVQVCICMGPHAHRANKSFSQTRAKVVGTLCWGGACRQVGGPQCIFWSLEARQQCLPPAFRSQRTASVHLISHSTGLRVSEQEPAPCCSEAPHSQPVGCWRHLTDEGTDSQVRSCVLLAQHCPWPWGTGMGWGWVLSGPASGLLSVSSAPVSLGGVCSEDRSPAAPRLSGRASSGLRVAVKATLVW